MNIYSTYYDSDTDEVFTIMDVYMEYQRERTAGCLMAEDFGEFTRWLDCYGVAEDGTLVPLWY